MTEIYTSWDEAGIPIPAGTPPHGSIRLLCPQCSSHRRKKTARCLSVELGKGLWNCHHCHWSGRLKRPPDGSWQPADEYERLADEEDWQVEQRIEWYQEHPPADPHAKPASNGPTSWEPPVNDAVQRAEWTPPTLVSGSDYLKQDIPPRKLLLDPWLESEGIVMIYARAGIGKSYFLHSALAAIATGRSFLGWLPAAELASDGTPYAPERNVTLFDGELSAIDLQTRIRCCDAIYPGFADQLRMYSADWAIKQGEHTLNIADRDQHPAIIEACDGADVVAFDNRSALAYTPGVSENDAESFEPLKSLFLELKARGSAVIFVHHAGKGGQQRGTSKAEDLIDVQMVLIEDENGDEGGSLRYQVKFEKNRGFDRPRPLLVAPTFEDRKLVGWDYEEAGTAKREEIEALLADGLKANEIVKMGFKSSYVYKIAGERRKK